jgi:hypothetical protein
MGHPSGRNVFVFAALLGLSASGSLFAKSGEVLPENDLKKLVQEVTYNEISAQLYDHSLWRYRVVREIDGKASRTYEVCETKIGAMERLVAIDGKPLDAKESREEDERIQRLVHNSDPIREKQRKEDGDSNQEQSLLKIFPEAFVFQFVGRTGNLIAMRFTPNPEFHPSGHVAGVFHHMEGTLIVDGHQKRLVKIDGQLMSEVKFMGGMLGHLDKGGTFLVKQRQIGNGHWDTTVMNVEMNGKILFFKTIAVHEKETYSDYAEVPADINVQQAAEILKENSTSAVALF